MRQSRTTPVGPYLPNNTSTVLSEHVALTTTSILETAHTMALTVSAAQHWAASATHRPQPLPTTTPHAYPPPSGSPGDLANMDALDPESAAKLPNLMALRDALYSQHFRRSEAHTHLLLPNPTL